MAYQVITAASSEPVSLAEARLHIKASDDTSEDELIEGWITAAREFAEHFTGVALSSQTIEMALDAFPCHASPITLDLPPVASITSIKYTDTSGAEQTLAPSSYALSLYGSARKVAPTYGNLWPATACVADAVRVRYVAGYTDCPKAAKSAILLIVGHLFENRQEVVVDTRVIAAQVPVAAMSLLGTIKAWAV